MEETNQRIVFLKQRKANLDRAIDMIDKDIVLIRQALDMIKGRNMETKKSMESTEGPAMQVDPEVDLSQVVDFESKRKMHGLCSQSSQEVNSSQRSQG